MAKRSEPILTIEDLDLMPDDGKRYELIGGELYVSEHPALTHQRTLGNILYSIASQLRGNPIGEILPALQVTFSKVDAVIPDLIFISSSTRDTVVRDDRITGAPDLAIEIVSPGATNSRRDRVAKRYLYAKFGVKEYWVVDPAVRQIEVYHHEGTALILSATLSEDDEITSTLLPGYKCRVGDFFV